MYQIKLIFYSVFPFSRSKISLASIFISPKLKIEEDDKKHIQFLNI